MMMSEGKRIITFGTFDLFHIGHLNILRRAKDYGAHLIAGVSSDALNYLKKQTYPIYRQAERLRIVSAIRWVDEVFLEESLELKEAYILHYRADLLVMGHDWEGRFDHLSRVCEIVYLPRTPDISSSQIKQILSEGG